MKTPKIIFRGSPLDEILAAGGLRDRSAVISEVVAAVRRAETIAGKGVRHLDATLEPRRPRGKKNAWRADPDLVRFLGPPPPTVLGMRATCRRLRRADRRIRRHVLKIRLLPQSRGRTGQTNGHNYGSFLSPLRFVLFPSWFRQGPDQRSGIIIHELLHEWHVDHKVRVDGRREVAYGAQLAELLAKQKPRQARRNPENFEQYCLAVKSRR